MRTYDMLLIVDPRLTDEEVAQLGARLQESLVGLINLLHNFGLSLILVEHLT